MKSQFYSDLAEIHLISHHPEAATAKLAKTIKNLRIHYVRAKHDQTGKPMPKAVWANLTKVIHKIEGPDIDLWFLRNSGPNEAVLVYENFLTQHPAKLLQYRNGQLELLDRVLNWPDESLARLIFRQGMDAALMEISDFDSRKPR